MEDENFSPFEDFTRRAMEATDKVNILVTIPQLTCGQFTQDEVMEPYRLGFRSIGDVREQDYETYQFYSIFYKKFSKEIAEYEEMKERLGDIGKDELRKQYLDDNNFSPLSNARSFNPCWKEYLGN